MSGTTKRIITLLKAMLNCNNPHNGIFKKDTSMNVPTIVAAADDNDDEEEQQEDDSQNNGGDGSRSNTRIPSGCTGVCWKPENKTK